MAISTPFHSGCRQEYILLRSFTFSNYICDLTDVEVDHFFRLASSTQTMLRTFNKAKRRDIMKDSYKKSGDACKKVYFKQTFKRMVGLEVQWFVSRRGS